MITLTVQYEELCPGGPGLPPTNGGGPRGNIWRQIIE